MISNKKSANGEALIVPFRKIQICILHSKLTLLCAHKSKHSLSADFSLLSRKIFTGLNRKGGLGEVPGDDLAKNLIRGCSVH